MSRIRLDIYLGTPIVVGLVWILIGAELISGSSEYLFHILDLHVVIAVTLWIVKKSIVDDHKLTLDEGLSILMILMPWILYFDELSLLI
jgi:hypothetical protein